ncbi:MAG: DUF4738 domain-containing protein [Bacteroidaceae bacterium]|nr:DUF4738 domain-containing protein [Bacteroidaceae bacterium]
MRYATSYFCMLLLMLASLTACGGGKSENAEQAEPVYETKTRQMPELQLTDTARCSGRSYVYRIHRAPSDALPKVTDDREDSYLDNTIRLTIRRDGADIFDQTFTKATFAGSIDREFYRAAILDGIRFVQAEPGRGLVFAFAVSYPDSDMSVPFLLTVSDEGTYSFVKAENLDRDEGDPVYASDEGV